MGNMDDEGYKNLYAAIYKEAVANDCREVRKKVKEVLRLKGACKQEVREYLEKNESRIKNLVCKAVHQESQDYGDGAKTLKIRTENITGIVNQAVNDFYGGMGNDDTERTGENQSDKSQDQGDSR